MRNPGARHRYLLRRAVSPRSTPASTHHRAKSPRGRGQARRARLGAVAPERPAGLHHGRRRRSRAPRRRPRPSSSAPTPCSASRPTTRCPWDELMPDAGDRHRPAGRALPPPRRQRAIKAVVLSRARSRRKVLPPDVMGALSRTLTRRSEKFDRDALARKLAEMGYRNVAAGRRRRHLLGARRHPRRLPPARRPAGAARVLRRHDRVDARLRPRRRSAPSDARKALERCCCPRASCSSPTRPRAAAEASLRALAEQVNRAHLAACASARADPRGHPSARPRGPAARLLRGRPRARVFDYLPLWWPEARRSSTSTTRSRSGARARASCGRR